uniref:Uncharacterized protein n=1 Tax=Myripristis murdjan TaxID=586833 RepID=A0A668AAH3_9TELE
MVGKQAADGQRRHEVCALFPLLFVKFKNRMLRHRYSRVW